MKLTELLSADRVAIRKRSGDDAFDKAAALRLLGSMLSGGGVDAAEVERVLVEREELQSTGIGEGVAIPPGALQALELQRAALLIVPGGVEFASIDQEKVTILFAVVGPKRATGEHLKTLARVSRLLRHPEFRERLVGAASGEAAFALIAVEEADPKPSSPDAARKV